MPNVFHPSFGSRPDRIVGRDEVIAQFLAGLDKDPGHRDRATLILGQRGMGKTALLLQLADEARAKRVRLRPSDCRRRHAGGNCGINPARRLRVRA